MRAPSHFATLATFLTMPDQPENPPPQIDARPPRKSRAPKNGAAKPTRGPALALVQVPLSQILGLDPEIAEFFREHDFNFETVTDFNIWSPEAAWWSYQIAPMVLIKRRGGFEVLGTGRAWRVAQSVFQAGNSVPALVLTDVKRASTDVKFQIVAAELFGLCADFRTRPNLPAKLLKLWRQMNVKGVDSIVGDDIKAFSRGTGYSLRALKSAKTGVSMTTATDQETENSARPVDNSAPPQPLPSGSDV
jgi:hypothetical protein